MIDNRTTLSEAEARWILDRAAKIEAGDVSTAVSIEELRAAASEAGFSPAVVDRAIAEALEQSGQDQSIVTHKGFVLSRLVTSLSVNVYLTDAQIRRVAYLNTAYSDKDPSVTIDDVRGWWKDRRGFCFEIRRGAHHSELQVSSPRLIGLTGPWKRPLLRAIVRLEAMVRFVAAGSEQCGFRAGCVAHRQEISPLALSLNTVQVLRARVRV